MIGRESRWTDNLPEVFADVNITNGEQNVEFRTPSVDLEAWKHGILAGFIDTSEMSGKYDVNIVLSYAGVQTLASGTLLVTRFDYMIIVWVAVGVGVLVVIFIILRVLKRKSRKMTKRRR